MAEGDEVGRWFDAMGQWVDANGERIPVVKAYSSGFSLGRDEHGRTVGRTWHQDGPDGERVERDATADELERALDALGFVGNLFRGGGL